MLDIEKTLSFILDMIILGKLNLTDIPVEIRISEISIYIAAFRKARETSIQEYEKNLQILKSDLDSCSNTDKKRMQYFYEEMEHNIKYCRD